MLEITTPPEFYDMLNNDDLVVVLPPVCPVPYPPVPCLPEPSLVIPAIILFMLLWRKTKID